MRRSLAEAREGHSECTPPYKEKVNDTAKSQKFIYGGSSQKPPVPPTKAIAVAKIREAIAQSKRESSQDLSK